MSAPLRVAVLVSGGGTNLGALVRARDEGQLPDCALTLVVSSRADVYALTRAQEAGVDSRVIDPKTADFGDRLLAAFAEYRIDIVVLAGFLSLIPDEVVARYRGRIINIHPSLIPSFCGDGFYGLRVHKAALDYGVKVTGATVHLVNEVTDGGRILLQKAVDVYEGDTPRILQQRVMEQAEWQLLPRGLHMLAQQLIKDGYSYE